MIKIRITYIEDEPGEALEFVEQLKQDGYTILNQSDIYKGRGKSNYNNLYIGIEKRN